MSSVTVVVAGRNDDHGGDFRERLFRTAAHNVTVMAACGLSWEYLFVEWNPVADRPRLADEFVANVPRSRAVVVPASVHDAYSRHPGMPFHEMPAKNAGIRRATTPWVLVTNADVMFDPEALLPLAAGTLDPRTLYRSQRADVSPELSFEQMHDPARHLDSGEGRERPVPYLGAGGDFCLASRDLWHELRGFDERIRFTTRGKDWQFFLSALARGIAVEFLGTVFHLDHPGGFQNTPAEVRRTAAAHFGGPWDIEFGLPTRNADGWGLGALDSDTDTHSPIATLVGDPGFSVSDDLATDALAEMTAGTEPDWLLAGWMHAVYGAWRAKRAMFVEIETPRAAALLEGFLSVARDAGVDVCGFWEWTPLDGFTLCGVRRAEKPPRGAWVVREHDGVLGLSIDGVPGPLWPEHRAPHEPAFNPLLARRALRAWIEMSAAGHRRAAIYGAGSHTRELLSFGWPDDQHLVGIITTTGSGEPTHGLSVMPIADLVRSPVDAVMLSSATYEPDMAVHARTLGLECYAPYADWLRPLGLSTAPARHAAGGSR